MSVTGPGCAVRAFQRSVVALLDTAAREEAVERDLLMSQGDAMGEHVAISGKVEAIELLRDEVAALQIPAPLSPDDSARERLSVHLTYDSRVPHGNVTVGRDPETDWRPLPSCAEVLAHNARLGGNFTSSPWLCVSDPSDLHADVRVVWLAIGRDDRVMCVGGSPDPTADPDVRVRPITRRGEALPWPEVPR